MVNIVWIKSKSSVIQSRQKRKKKQRRKSYNDEKYQKPTFSKFSGTYLFAYFWNYYFENVVIFIFMYTLYYILHVFYIHIYIWMWNVHNICTLLCVIWKFILSKSIFRKSFPFTKRTDGRTNEQNETEIHFK